MLSSAFTEPQGPLGCPDAPGCRKTPVTRHVRCLYLTDPTLNQEGTTGRFGYVVRIQAAERGRPFTLVDQTGLPATVDFDIVFFSDLGTCEGEPFGPNPQPSPSVSYGRIGNESGTIPAGTNFAIVVMIGGANGEFRLRIT